MKAVVCPVCQKSIFSESFVADERFTCPNCEHEVTVTLVQDAVVLKTVHDLVSNAGWAAGLWRDGRLRLTQERLAALGEFVVASLRIEEWSKLSPEQLRELEAKFERSRRALEDAGGSADLFLLARTLLDVYRQGSAAASR